MRAPTKHVARNGTTTWRIRLVVDGKQTSETFASRQAAKAFASLADAIGPAAAIKSREAQAEAPTQALTLDELHEQWHAWKATHQRTRTGRTMADYRRNYLNHISPVLGHLPAAAITEADVARLVSHLNTKPGPRGLPLSPKTVGDYHALLSGILKWAAAPAQSLIPRNPCIGTELARKTKSKAKGLNPAEWQALHAAMVELNPDAADLALFLVSSGWRFSEATALSRFDVDDQPASMHVTMRRVVRRTEANTFEIVDDGKEHASLRRVGLDDWCADMVRTRMAKVAGGGLVFTTRNGTMWRHSHYLERAWNPALAKAGLLDRGHTPHSLRHTHAFELGSSGQVTLPELQARLGHANIQTTIGVYGGLFTDVATGALNTAAARMRGQQAVPDELAQRRAKSGAA